MAALSFGHLPAVFVPSGPMEAVCQIKKKCVFASFMPKVKGPHGLTGVRSRVLPCAGNMYFYGTANTNQMVVEFMGMQLQALLLFIRILRCAML